MMHFRVFVLLIWVGLAACEKDEIPIAPYDRGPMMEGMVTLGAGYSSQVFFSFEDNAAAGENGIDEWDLAFEGGENGWKVVLNDARMMSAWKSDFSELSQAADSAGFGQGKNVEYAAVKYDEPVLGDWRGDSPVYLVDLGYNAIGLPMGFCWLQIRQVNPAEYSIAYRRMHSDETTEKTVPKVPGTAFTRFSISGHQTLPTPADADWDLQFTKYSYRFLDPPMDYLVTGVVTHPEAAVAEVSHLSFEEISAADTAALQWSTQPDAIGYDWKSYDFGTGTYTLDVDRAWIIRSHSGFYYKMRFTDYYDSQGNAGAPGFEFGKI